MNTYELYTVATTITTIKANSKKQALEKFYKLSDAQLKRRTRICGNIEFEYDNEDGGLTPDDGIHLVEE